MGEEILGDYPREKIQFPLGVLRAPGLGNLKLLVLSPLCGVLHTLSG